MKRAPSTSRMPDPRKWSGLRLLLLLILAGLGIETAGADAFDPLVATSEYQVKAAFLLNFAQFIEWPTAAFTDAQAPITVGILGDDPFGNVLEQIFQDESPQGRKLVVKRSRHVDDLKTCHMLFISKSEKDKVAEILASLGDASIVTVGEIDGFAQRGGIINFYIESSKVRFEINADAAKHKGLKINSQLLKRAKIVGSDSGKGKD